MLCGTHSKCLFCLFCSVELDFKLQEDKLQPLMKRLCPTEESLFPPLPYPQESIGSTPKRKSKAEAKKHARWKLWFLWPQEYMHRFLQLYYASDHIFKKGVQRQNATLHVHLFTCLVTPVFDQDGIGFWFPPLLYFMDASTELDLEIIAASIHKK